MSDQTPPVASSQQGRTPCLDPTCDCCRVHTRTERELEARIRELEEECNLHVADLHETAAEMFRYRRALEKISRRDPEQDNSASTGTGNVPESPLGDIARRALNRETTDE